MLCRFVIPSLLVALLCSAARVNIELHKHLIAKKAEYASGDYDWIPIKMKGCSEFCNAYVSVELGSDDSTSGHSVATPFRTLQYAVDHRVLGQTIHVMNGVYRNSRFGEGIANDPVVNLNGVTDLTIKSYQDHKPKLEFDSSGGMIGRNVVRVKIDGLEIEGVNAAVTYGEAMEGRLQKSPRLHGRGIAIWSGHHIQFQDMNVHHCPGSGLRVNNGDYVLLSDSEVYSNCWWSSSAESGIVFAESKSADEATGVKMIMRRNKVYDNMNKVPYYNPSYAWYKSPIASGKNCHVDACNPHSESFDQKVCPWQCQYGKSYQDYICDGMGVYVTRNNLVGGDYKYGMMELSGNEAFGNGINGIVFHRTDRGVVINNLVYNNGAVPRYISNSTEDWQKALSKGRQPYAGITINNAHDVKLANNIVYTAYDTDNAFTMEYDHGEERQPVSSDSKWNKVCRGKHFQEDLGPPNLFVFPGPCSEQDKRCCLPAH